MQRGEGKHKTPGYCLTVGRLETEWLIILLDAWLECDGRVATEAEPTRRVNELAVRSNLSGANVVSALLLFFPGKPFRYIGLCADSNLLGTALTTLVGNTWVLG